MKKYTKLKAYRMLQEKKQEDLAELLNIGLNTYNMKENGKNPFTLEEAKKLADYFSTTIEDIFFVNEVNTMNTLKTS